MPIEERHNITCVIPLNDTDCSMWSLPPTAITDQGNARLIIAAMTQSLLVIRVPGDSDLAAYLLMLFLQLGGGGGRFSTVVLLLRLEKTVVGHVITTENPRALRKGTEW